MLLEDSMMSSHDSISRRLGFILIVSVLALTLAADGWAEKKKKKKSEGSASVTKVINKVDRQILSYSPVKARELLEPVMDAKDPRVNAEMGRILMLEKNYDGAASKLQAASKMSDDPLIVISLGDSYGYAKNQSKAKSSYQQASERAQAALAKDPTDKNARLALGIAQQRLKNYDEALSNLKKAESNNPNNERIPFELGLTQMLRGDNQAGFDHLSRAIALNSGYAYAYYYRALAAQKIGRKDITVNDLDRFLRLAPEAPEAPKAERILQAARG
jgi:tetratricopeptide (TPR) repeat protein